MTLNTTDATDGAGELEELAAAMDQDHKGEVVETPEAATAEKVEDKKENTDKVEEKVSEKPETPAEKVEPEKTEEVKSEETEPVVEKPLSELTEKEQIDIWKGLSRKNETELKQAVASLKQKDALIGEKTQKIETLELENTKLTVALAKGLSGDDLEYLNGTTKEALEASADKFIARIGGAKTAGNSFAPNPFQGLGTGKDKVLKDNPESWMEDILGQVEN